MPRFRSRQLQQRQRRERRPDHALFDKPTSRLQAGAQEGVRSAADPQPGRRSVVEQPLAAEAIEGQRLLVPNVPSSRDRLTCNLGMSRRNREVDHDLHTWVVEHGGDVSSGGDVVLGGLQLSSLGKQVADRKDVGVGEAGEVLQVGVADRPAPTTPMPTGPAIKLSQ